MKTLKQSPGRSARFLFPVLFALIVGAIGVRLLSPSHADTLQYNATANWDSSSCSGTVDGAQTQYYGVAQGDSDMNITINNTSSQTLNAVVSDPSGQLGTINNITPGQIDGGGVYSFSQWLEVDVYSTTCNSSNNNGFLIIEAASGNLACNLTSNNQSWNVSGSFNNTVPTVTLYNGAQYESTSNATFLNNTHSTTNINGTYGANSAGTTYYLYNGSSSASRLIGQVSCPPAPSSPAASTPKASSSSPASSSSNSPSSPAASSTAPSTATNTPSATANSVAKNQSPTTKSIHTTNTAAKVTVDSITIVVVLAGAGWLLMRLGIIKLKLPKKGNRR